MEKVKLTKRQIEALEHARSTYQVSELIAAHAQYGFGWSGRCYALRTMNLDTLIKALYYGYEALLTPEERLLEAYKNYEQSSLSADDRESRELNHMVCLGIKLAVETLGIKIEGINTP